MQLLIFLTFRHKFQKKTLKNNEKPAKMVEKKCWAAHRKFNYSPGYCNRGETHCTF